MTKTKGKEHGFVTKVTKKLKLQPFQYRLTEMTQT